MIKSDVAALQGEEKAAINNEMKWNAGVILPAWREK